jgi:ABC-2 type transport system permease protein
MIFNLVRAEFTRLVTRRFTQVMVVLLVAAFGVTLATTLATTHRPSGDEMARAEQRAQSERTSIGLLREQCERAKLPDAPFELRVRYDRVDCRIYDPDQVTAEDFLAGVFSFTGSIRDLVLFLGAFLALFGFLVGASFVGAELTSGGMTNLLLWRPRRLHVLGAKLGTLLAGLTGLGVLATLLYIGTFWALAEVAGSPGHQTGQFWGDLLVVCLRGLALALVAAAIGFALATVGRHTSTAVGLLAGYAVVWEIGARLVMEIVVTDQPGRWVLSSYLAAWMDGRLELYDRAGPYTLQWWHSGLVFAVLLGAIVGGAFAQFRHRDLA